MVSEPLQEPTLKSMASSSSSSVVSPNSQTETNSTLTIIPNFSQLFKLEGPNHLGWVPQFQPILHGNDLLGLIEGTDLCPIQFLSDEGNIQTLNPTYIAWQKKDQLLPSWIIFSLSPSLVSSVYGLDTSHQAWTSLAARYAYESKSRVSHLKQQLQSLQQGSKTCTKYMKLAKELVDELATMKKPVEDDDLISFVVSGLNPLFNTFVTVHFFTARTTEMTFADFQFELHNHEMLLENQ